jgi:ferrous iron transport protein B
MRAIGLPGKAFFPLVIGFGCNVPAIMAVRGLNSEREKVAVAMMAPFMSCGARLSIYALFCAAFFPNNGQNIVFCLYLIGICVAILTALLLRHTMLKSEPEYLILELPNYHLPTLRGVLVKTYDRLKSFVFGAGKPIVVVFIFLQCFNSVGFDFTFNNQNNGKSVLSIIGKAINPIFAPMGIKEDNWPASVGIFTGIFAKEVLVGSLNSLYSSIGNQTNSVTYETNPIAKVSLAIKSIPEDVFKIYNNLTNPLWLNLSNHDFTQNFLATEEGTSSRVYQIMRDKFDGKIGAFSYLLFILLYFPCISVFGVIVKEISMRWAIFSAVWSTSIAYIIAVGFYQCSQLVNRLESLSAVLLSFFIIMLLASFSFGIIKYQKAGG